MVAKVEVVVSSTPILSSLRGAKKTLVPTAAAPLYLLLAVTPAAVVLMVEKVLVTVSSTPTLSSLRGAKKTLVPTATAPEYLLSAVTPAAVVPMVEKGVLMTSLASARCAHSHKTAAIRKCLILREREWPGSWLRVASRR